MNQKSYYDLLKIKKDASEAEIKAAYRKLASAYHPDKYPENTKFAEDMMKQINAAFSVLSDPVKRTQYDEWLNSDEGKPSSTSEASSPSASSKQWAKGFYNCLHQIKPFFNSNKKLKLVILLIVILVTSIKFYDYFSSLPNVVKGFGEYRLDEKIDDFKFKHSLKASPTLDTTSTVAYLSSDEYFLFRFDKTKRTLDEISHLCTDQSSKYKPDINGVGCSDNSGDILKKYGEANVLVLCSKDLAKPNNRIYQISSKGISYFLTSNSITQITISPPKENKLVEQGAWGVCGVDNAQASSMLAKPVERMTETEFRNQFICPEHLASEKDRMKKIEETLTWLVVNKKSITPDEVANFRYSLLKEHNCTETLANVKKSSIESDRFTQEDADKISKRFNAVMGKSGMAGITADIQSCYQKAMTDTNKVQSLRSCIFYDYGAIGIDKGFRQSMKERSGREMGPTTEFLSDASYKTRLDYYKGFAFDGYSYEQINAYFGNLFLNPLID